MLAFYSSAQRNTFEIKLNHNFMYKEQLAMPIYNIQGQMLHRNTKLVKKFKNSS